MVVGDEYEVEAKIIKKEKLKLICDRCGRVLREGVFDAEDKVPRETFAKYASENYDLNLEGNYPGYFDRIYVKRSYTLCADCRQDLLDMIDTEIKAKTEERPFTLYKLMNTSRIGRLLLSIARMLYKKRKRREV